MGRKVPKLTTDEAAERFLDQDLSDLDFMQFKPVKFEFEATDERDEPRSAPDDPPSQRRPIRPKP